MWSCTCGFSSPGYFLITKGGELLTIPCPRAKEKPQQDGRRGKIVFRIKPHTARDTQRAQTYLVHTRTQRPHRGWDRTVFECLLRRYRSAEDCCRGRGSGCNRPGYSISPVGEGHHWLHHRAARTYTGLGKQTLGGHKQNLVHTRTQEKGAVTPQETDSDLSMSIQESPAEVCVSSGLLQGWGHWVWQCLHGTFRRRSPSSSLPPPQFGLRSNNRKGTQLHPSTENWIKDLLSMAPPIRIGPTVSLSQSLLSESFHKPLILLHLRTDRLKTTITEN